MSWRKGQNVRKISDVMCWKRTIEDEAETLLLHYTKNPQEKEKDRWRDIRNGKKARLTINQWLVWMQWSNYTIVDYQ